MWFEWKNSPSTNIASGGKTDVFFHALIPIVRTQHMMLYIYGLGHKNNSFFLFCIEPMLCSDAD